MRNSKVEDLSKRTLKLLEKTKKETEKYKNERKKLFQFWLNGNELEKWDEYVTKLEELICSNDKYDKF